MNVRKMNRKKENRKEKKGNEGERMKINKSKEMGEMEKEGTIN